MILIGDFLRLIATRLEGIQYRAELSNGTDFKIISEDAAGLIADISERPEFKAPVDRGKPAEDTATGLTTRPTMQ